MKKNMREKYDNNYMLSEYEEIIVTIEPAEEDEDVMWNELNEEIEYRKEELVDLYVELENSMDVGRALIEAIEDNYKNITRLERLRDELMQKRKVKLSEGVFFVRVYED